MGEFERLKKALSDSVELSKLGDLEKALKLLDNAIAIATQEGDHSQSVITLCHHAAVLCHSTGNFTLVKRYYEQSLIHNPDNPRALYGLAKVALDQGDADTARVYAKKSYEVTVEGDDEIAKRGLLDVIAKHWPDIAAK
jgi:tetratricopeptide (TPR) repeat protein